MATPLTLNVKDVLSFFDHISPISNGHVSAVVGVVGEDLGIALLQRCLRHQHGIVSRVITKGGMPITPTNGTGKGHRLDRWLLADASDDHKRTVYQVEVKNWSATAIGGKELRVDAPDSTVRSFRKERWLSHWDADQGRFRYEIVGKVLDRMKLPAQMDDVSGKLTAISPPFQQAEVEPLVCFWWATHHSGEDESLFRYPLVHPVNGFMGFWVFSMSNYLRSIQDTEIELEMPSAARRIQWLNQLFK
ncbi:MAG: hypothetical protein EXQ47_01985 [Bryobacterales bacterium]|nr:hypothetical protein [Bryobacterales bacterium]